MNASAPMDAIGRHRDGMISQTPLKLTHSPFMHEVCRMLQVGVGCPSNYSLERSWIKKLERPIGRTHGALPTACKNLQEVGGGSGHSACKNLQRGKLLQDDSCPA